MTTLKIYGNPISRASRPIWMAEELGLDYELETEGFAGRDRCSPEFLAMNPNGTIPVIDDGGFILWESMAITLHLAKRHGGPLAPASLEEDSSVTQWSLWAVAEIEKPALEIVLHRMSLPPDRRDAGRVQQAADALRRPLAALECVLKDQDHLVGERFTVADLNVCSVLLWAKAAEEVFAELPSCSAYIDRARSRPAYRALRERQRAAALPSWVVERVARAS